MTNAAQLVTPFALGCLANRNTQSANSTIPKHCTFNVLGMGSKTFQFVDGLPKTHSYDIFPHYTSGCVSNPFPARVKQASADTVE